MGLMDQLFGKKSLKVLLDEVYYQLRIHRLRSSMRPGRAQQALSEHREILAALTSRNPDAAEGTMRRHIRNARLNTLSVMAEAEESETELTRPSRQKAKARA